MYLFEYEYACVRHVNYYRAAKIFLRGIDQLTIMDLRGGGVFDSLDILPVQYTNLNIVHIVTPLVNLILLKIPLISVI